MPGHHGRNTKGGAFVKYYGFLLFVLGALAGGTIPTLIIGQFGVLWSGLAILVWVVVAVVILGYLLIQELRNE